MDSKSRIGPNGTYIFDPQELAQLEELSFTTILDQASDAADLTPAVAARSAQKPPSEASPRRERQGDPEINALLDGIETGLK